MREYVKNTVKQALFKPLRGYRRILSIGVSALLSISTFLTVIPQTETIVYADNDKTITGLCTGAIGNPAEGAGGWSYVYYGKYVGNAMKYRVLDTAATQFNTEKTMLLDCDSTITNKNYHTSGSSVSWDGSEIKSWLNSSEFYGDYDNTDVFTRQEQAAIASSTKAAADGGDGKGWRNDDNDSDLVIYAPLTGEHIFFLDAKEATRTTYGYANNNGEADANRVKSESVWWLRSVAKQDVYYFGGHAGYVKAEGGISHEQGVKNYGVSPAFNLNLKSVIFSSLIPDKTNEFKLTVKDNNMTIAKKDGSNVTRAGNVVTVPYKISGINDEAATQVSVLLTDEEYSAGVAATEGFSYLKLNVGSWGTSGTGTFTLPADYANKTCGEDYYAYILAETVNDGTATDYASAPATITIPDATAEQVATPTFSPAEGTYATAQNVEIKCDTAGADIYYTTDGSEPSKNSGTKYTSAISVSDTTTIKAIAVKDGMTDSSVASARYTINIPGKVATPTFTPAAGTYATAQNVEIKCDTAGADIYYTTDGSEPSKNSGTKYTSAISVSDTTTIKAIAVKDGMTDSSVASARYTISDTPVDTCTITFEPNGGKGEMDDQTVDKGVRTQLNKNKFTRSGYSFDGWNTRADGRGTGYEDRDHVTVNDNTTLYAQWTKDKPKPDPKEDDDDEEENKEPAKPAAVNPDTVEGYFAVNGQPVPGVAMGKTVQGVAAQAVFNATRPAGFLQAFTFNMAINGKVDYTLKNGVLTIIIPKEFQKAGRTFAIMALDKNGKAWTFADTDNNPNTVTATINVEGYAFALIYKD